MMNGLIAPLFVPGDRPDRFGKAAASGADGMIVDLEDAVGPDSKERARAAMSTAPSFPVAVVVRINPPSSPWFEEDLKAVRARPNVGVMLPKGEDPALIRDVAQTFEGRRFVVLVETALGLARAVDLAQIPGVSQLAFGPADFCSDVGCDPTPDALLAARSALVLASRLAGLAQPLDGPSFAIEDPSDAARTAAYARTLGFGGKLCVHPRQVAAVRAAFRPSGEEVEWAQRVLAVEVGSGAVCVDGMMVDAPILARARRILDSSV